MRKRSDVDAEKRDTLESSPKKISWSEDARAPSGVDIKSDRSEFDGVEKSSEVRMEPLKRVA